jgi:hypothetical protein
MCVACGRERPVEPETTVLEGGRLVRIDALSLGGVEPASVVFSRLYRFAGILVVGSAILAGATVAAWGAPKVFVAGTAALVGLLGILAIVQAARVEARSRERRRRQLEQRVIALAERQRGDLVATHVARELRIGLDEADALLTSLVDGVRVAVEVDSEGIVHYVFREIAAGASGPKARVEREPSDPTDGEAAERVERELRRRERL